VRKLRDIFGDADLIHLILDLYSAHRRAHAKATANQLGIIPHFIPAGPRDEFQPLARLVFGALKAIARYLSQQAFWEDRQHVFNRQWAAAQMIQACDRLQSHVIKET
jgi:hypothetical protein